MIRAIMITFALTTICCFANGDVADGNDTQELRDIQSELEDLIKRVKAKQKEFNTTVKAELTKRQPNVDSSISSANGSILTYAENFEKNGAKANPICQSKFDEYAKDLTDPSYADNLNFCISLESERFKSVYLGTGRLIALLDSVINHTSTNLDEDKKAAVRSYDYSKEYIEKNILGTDDEKMTLTERTTKCFNDLEERIKGLIKNAEVSTKHCIDTDGAEWGLPRESST